MLATTRTRAALPLVLLGAVLTVMLLASPARAHASLLGGSVADGQVVEVAPEELFLEFNEPVDTPRSGLRVFDASGARVDVGGTFGTGEEREIIRTELAEDLQDGTYAVTYRVTSADGHPINGAFVFSVGAEAQSGDALLGQVFAGDADRPWAVLAAVVRWVMYAGTLLAAGAVMTAAWLGRGPGVPAAVDGGGGRRRLIARAATAALAASVLGTLVQAVLVTGDGIASLADVGALSATLSSFVGIAAVVRVLGAAAVLVGLRRGDGGVVPLVGAGLLVTSLLLEGHTLTTGPAIVVWTAGVIHVITAATWFGGLWVMLLELRSRRRADDPVGAGRLVQRFSSLFTASVIAVVLAGSALSWVEVRALRAFTSTTYGWLLIGKLVAVVPLIALGIHNNRRLVPALTARRRSASRATAQPVVAGGSDEAGAAASSRDRAWDLLRRTIRWELAAVGVVLALTSVLVAVQPAAEAAGVTGAFSQTQPFEGIGQMTITVDPNRAGRNEIHLYLLSDVGRPVDISEDVTISLSHPDLDIGPIERPAVYAGKGHFILAGPELSVPGRWDITTEVAVSRFENTATTTSVVVNP